MSAMEAISGALALLFPALRQDSETKQGPHRSATPESVQMNLTSIAQTKQGPLGFIREGQVIFTPADAKAVLDHCRYERQRDETKARAHIGSLAEQMRRGLWLPKTQLDFARVGGNLVLVNGHHRMHAQIAAATNILWNVIVHDCDDADQVAALYWKFDTTLRKRTSVNVIDGIGLAEDIGLEKGWATGLWNAAQVISLGMKFYFHERDGSPLLPDDRVTICRDYAQEALWVQGSAKKAILPIRSKLKKVSFLAPSLVVLRHNPVIGRDFIDGLCADDGLTKGDPRKTLLADMQVRKGGKNGLFAAQMLSFAIAWSAFYHQRDLKIIKVTGHPVPLAGTPYTVQA